MEQFSRQNLLIGEDGTKKLHASHVAIFGIGGVGSYAFEALVRAGVGKISIFDFDIVAISNLNRQLVALHSTLGQLKVEVAKKRALDINPNVIIEAYPVFYDESTCEKYDLTQYDYIIDAIDVVKSKILLIMYAQKAQVKIISSMGAGNKLDPTKFEVADIYKTSVCPLAKIMRRELKQNNIKELKVVYSTQNPVIEKVATIPSIGFVPSVVGLILAGEVVKDLVKK